MPESSSPGTEPCPNCRGEGIVCIPGLSSAHICVVCGGSGSSPQPVQAPAESKPEPRNLESGEGNPSRDELRDALATALNDVDCEGFPLVEEPGEFGTVLSYSVDWQKVADTVLAAISPTMQNYHDGSGV